MDENPTEKNKATEKHRVDEDNVKELIAALKSRGLTVSFAESLTAGLISATVADIPGASAVLRGGFITYSDSVKHELLGVSEKTLSEHTAVSAETASEMAEGCMARLGTDIAVSATGYAGPSGGEDGTPVGRVFIGVSFREKSPGKTKKTEVFRFNFDGGRHDIRTATVNAAINVVLKILGANDRAQNNFCNKNQT